MLKLDEKKIRKGKPVGLPYQGSKKKISKKIVEIIKQNFDADKPIYDVFGGGGAITAECVLNGLEVHYNDLDNDITDMFQRVISQDREWIKTLIISRDEFNKIRQKEPKSVDDNLKLLVNSFGNELSSYLYGADWSDTKYDLAVEIINKHDVFSGYKQTETYKKADKPYDEGELEKNKKLTQLEQLQQLG
ncbi:TPA: DNA adenine methylase, partial [Streptococcus pyogenes]